MSLRVCSAVLSAVLSQAGPALAQSSSGSAPSYTGGSTADYERQQREYWRAQEAERMEQQRRQQIYDEQRRRDEEASKRNFRIDGGSPSPGSAPSYSGGSSGGSQAAAEVAKARRELEKQPPLPADRNKLLGRWKLDTAKRRPANALEELMQPLSAGTCSMVFGTGIWEFRPQQIVNSDSSSPDMVIAAQYRGNAQTVAVLPKEHVQLMVFEFVGPDRVRERVASAVSGDAAKCEFVRVGAAAAASAAASGAPSSAAAAPPQMANAAPVAARSTLSHPSPEVCRQTLVDKLGKVGVNQVRAMSDVRFKEPAIEGRGPAGNHRIDLRGSACDDPRIKATLYDFDASGMLQSITYVWDRPAGPAPAPIFLERLKTLSQVNPGLPQPQAPGRLQADTSLGRLTLQDLPERNLLLEAYAAKN